MNNLSKANWQLFWFGIFKIPAIRFSRASITTINKEELVLKIPNKRRNRNHLNSIYIANFTIGADLACGFLAFQILQERKIKASLLFKSFNAQFLKRAESDLYFRCTASTDINEMIDESINTGLRQNKEIKIDAFVVQNKQEEIVAQMHIELSIKVKS